MDAHRAGRVELGVQALYRRVMGHLPTGVTVVTIGHDGAVHGMTANAVTSVSLDPPLLALCVDCRGRMRSWLERAGHFAVNILAADQEWLARRFATRMADAGERFRGVSCEPGSTGDPLLDGCLGHLCCRVEGRVPAGDHVLFIARPITLSTGERSAAPLVFFRGDYEELSTTRA